MFLVVILQNISEGYAIHLNELVAPGGCRPAQGNARILIPRGFFSFPSQGGRPLRRRYLLKLLYEILMLQSNQLIESSLPLQ
jgi:hypothetical protein